MRGERILCADLAAFLGVGVITVNKYARDRNCLHHFEISRAKSRVWYVSPFTAARIIVWVRAMQQWKRDNKGKKLPV